MQLLQEFNYLVNKCSDLILILSFKPLQHFCIRHTTQSYVQLSRYTKQKSLTLIK